MKEVEVKAKVKDLAVIKDKLNKLGCKFTDVLIDQDKIFVNSDKDFAEFQTDANFVRIRKRGEKTILTLKRPLKNELDCIEHELEISDAEKMQKILELSGYHSGVEVEKKRIKTEYNGWEICLDEINDLGSFIEVEKLTENEDSERIQNELFEFLKTLGISEEDRVVNGYDTLVYLKKTSRL